MCLYNLGGTIYATHDTCTHGQASLADGFIDGDEIECPLHQGLFQIATGKAVGAPCTGRHPRLSGEGRERRGAAGGTRMRICRFDDDRLGLVKGDEVLDVTAALEAIPQQRWPLAPGDPLIANLDRVLERVRALESGRAAPQARRRRLKSPVANPTKIVNAPINYQAHIDEAKADPKLGGGRKLNHITDWGLFLKATSALIGPGEPIRLRMPDRRNDPTKSSSPW